MLTVLILCKSWYRYHEFVSSVVLSCTEDRFDPVIPDVWLLQSFNSPFSDELWAFGRNTNMYNIWNEIFVLYIRALQWHLLLVFCLWLSHQAQSYSEELKLEFQQKHWGGYSSTVTVPKRHLSALRDWHTQALKGCRACEHSRLLSFLIKSCQRWLWLQLNEKIDAELMWGSWV